MSLRLTPANQSPLQSGWDCASISACLVDAYERAGKLPTIAHMREMYGIAESQFSRCFANFSAACRAADLPVPLRSSRWTTARMIEAAKAYAASGAAPSSRAWTKATADHPSAVTVRAQWPSWQAFINDAGLTGSTSSEATQRMWNRAMIIEALIRWATENGTWPRKKDWSQRGSYWPADVVVRDVFGRWSTAVSEAQDVCNVSYARPKVGGARAGLAGRRRVSVAWTAELIIAAAQQWKTLQGQWPAADDWRGAGSSWPGYRSVRREFASWGDMLLAAGRTKPERSTLPSKRKAMSYELAQKVFVRDNYTCQNPCCDGLCSRLSVDHIVAVVDEGSDDLDNLQTLCTTCNARKGRYSWANFLVREANRMQSITPA